MNATRLINSISKSDASKLAEFLIALESGSMVGSISGSGFSTSTRWYVYKPDIMFVRITISRTRKEFKIEGNQISDLVLALQS